MKVTVVDYGIGNLHSVIKALKHEGASVSVSADSGEIERAERVVLPGVGAFADGMRGLTERGLVAPLKAFVATGRPFLGICLGMQLLLSESEEFGRHRGLDLVSGRVVAIPKRPGLKIPQIGWNRIAPSGAVSWQGTLLSSLAPGTMVYFVHSFTAVPEDERHRLADTDYGGYRVSAAIRKNNVVGCQFHPEKSGPAGLSIIQRFLAG